MVYLKILSVVEAIWRRMNNELKKIWKETSRAYFEVLSERPPGGYEENNK
jgi:hypothetical protein